MSYGRDPDAYTRGAGAVAAADRVNPRATAARAAGFARALAVRDRALSGLTYGERGGLGNVGLATKVVYKPRTRVLPPPRRVIIAPPTRTGSSLTTTRLAVSRTPVPAFTPITPPKINAGSFGPTAPPSATVRPPSIPPLILPPGSTVQYPGQETVVVGLPPPPIQPAPPTRKISELITKASGGRVTPAGGGGGTWSPTLKQTAPVPAMPASVDLPDVESDAGAPGSEPSTKTIAFVGAAALAAYLLVRNRGR